MGLSKNGVEDSLVYRCFPMKKYGDELGVPTIIGLTTRIFSSLFAADHGQPIVVVGRSLSSWIQGWYRRRTNPFIAEQNLSFQRFVV
jgi:hypothetical protein